MLGEDVKNLYKSLDREQFEDFLKLKGMSKSATDKLINILDLESSIGKDNIKFNELKEEFLLYKDNPNLESVKKGMELMNLKNKIEKESNRLNNLVASYYN